jgi:hypothetical protein
VSFLVLLSISVTAPAFSASNDGSYELLLNYANQIKVNATSVYQRSTATLSSLDATKPLTGGASLQVWSEGLNKYRYESRVNNTEGETDYDITYDGQQYSWYNLKSKLMTLSTNDSEILMTSQNLLLLPAQYLSKESDSCLFCQLKLNDFADVNALRNRLHILSSRQDGSTTEFLLAGQGTVETKFNWRVVFDRTNSLIPKSIRKEAENGVLIEEFSFPQQESIILDGRITLWPRTAVYVGIDADTKQVFKMVYEIEDRWFGREIKTETFFPNTNAANIILDGDVNGRVIKRLPITVRSVRHRPAVFVLMILLSLLPLACFFYNRKFRRCIGESCKLNFFAIVGIATLTCYGCRNKASATKSVTPEKIPFILGQGTERVHFGDDKAAVVAAFGNPSFENERVLTYTNIGMDVWMSKNDHKVNLITGGSIESMNDAIRFVGLVNDSIGIGSSRSEIIDRLGNPSSSEFHAIEGTSQKDEVLTFKELGLQVRCREQRAILFLFQRVAE